MRSVMLFVWLGVAVGSGIVGVALLTRAGVSDRARLHAVVWSVVACAVLLVVQGIHGFSTCGPLARPGPLTYPFSPTRRFCRGELPETLGMGLLPVVTVACVIVATLCFARGRDTAGMLASLAVLGSFALPAAYYAALPAYEIGRYPVFHSGLVRAATSGVPARVCFLYGPEWIGPGRPPPVPPNTRRYCADLADTNEALALWSGYGHGTTDHLGRELTQRDGDDWVGASTFMAPGLTVVRAYTLTEARAQPRYLAGP